MATDNIGDQPVWNRTALKLRLEAAGDDGYETSDAGEVEILRTLEGVGEAKRLAPKPDTSGGGLRFRPDVTRWRRAEHGR